MYGTHIKSKIYAGLIICDAYRIEIMWYQCVWNMWVYFCQKVVDVSEIILQARISKCFSQMVNKISNKFCERCSK